MIIANVEDCRKPCEARLPRFLNYYIDGGSFCENTPRANSVTSTIRALPKVVDAIQGRVPVFMDGGIRSGLDVLKASALGAKACFVRRPWAYAAGEAGIRDMLEILKEELRVSMILTGCNDVNRATPDLLLEDLPSLIHGERTPRVLSTMVVWIRCQQTIAPSLAAELFGHRFNRNKLSALQGA